MGSRDKTQRAAEGTAGIRTAHDAMMLDDGAKVLAEARKQVAGYASNNGIKNGHEEEGGMIHVGDKLTYNESKPSLIPGLAKLALGAGLLATGIGAPVAAYMLKDALLPKAGAVFEDKEKDFGLGFFEPKP